MAKITIAPNTYLTLVKLSDEAKRNVGKLLETIEQVDRDYMAKFGHAGAMTYFDAALIGPYDFAILYTGPTESAVYLAARIAERVTGEAVTMAAVGLDTFRKMFAE